MRSAFADYPDRPVKDRGGQYARRPLRPGRTHHRGRVAAASTGKTFIIENIGGGGSNIGMGYVATFRRADGYTILLATNAYSVNASLYNKIPYDPLKDFVR